MLESSSCFFYRCCRYCCSCSSSCPQTLFHSFCLCSFSHRLFAPIMLTVATQQLNTKNGKPSQKETANVMLWYTREMKKKKKTHSHTHTNQQLKGKDEG